MIDLIKIPQSRAFKQVNAQASYYPNFVRVYIPKVSFSKLKDGLETRDILASDGEKDKSRTESNLERSLRRSRKQIKDLVFCNTFQHFVTLTIATDRQDIPKSKNKVLNWIKNESKRKGKFSYIVVPEFHRDQKSLHFHCLFQNYQGVVKQSFQANGKPVIQSKRKVYELPSYTNGYTNVKILKPDNETATKVGFYIQKYITKQMPVLFGKNRYWASRDLKRPILEDNPQPWYEVVTPDRKYETDYGLILEFDIHKNVLVDMFWEHYYK